MNVGSSAVMLGKVSRALPSEKDLPSFPTIDLKKKRKQAKPSPSLPPRRKLPELVAEAVHTTSTTTSSNMNPTTATTNTTTTTLTVYTISDARILSSRGGGTLGLSAQQRRKGSRPFVCAEDGKRDIRSEKSRGASKKDGKWSVPWKPPGRWWGGNGEEDHVKGKGRGNYDGYGGGSTAAGSSWFRPTGGTAAADDGASESAGEVAASGEMKALLALCTRIETECLQQQQDEEGGETAKNKEKINEFETTKNKIEEILRNTGLLIAARQEIRTRKGTTLETVRLGGEIHDNITLLRELFNQLSAAYGRLFKQRKTLRLSDEQLEHYHAEICRLMRAIEDLRRESKRVAGGGGAGGILIASEGSLTRIRTLTELQKQQSGGAGGGSTTEGNGGWWGTDVATASGRESPLRAAAPEVVSEEDLAVIKRWKERDAEFDKQVAEIGDAIDRIANVTAQIGEKAEVQRELIQQVQQQTDATTAELQQVTQKVKDVIGKQSNVTFFTRLFLIVILVFLICFVISVIYSRYIKN